MTRDEAKQLLELMPVIQAFANGKEVQYQVDGAPSWYDAESPTFFVGKTTKWRIKALEVWVSRHSDGRIFAVGDTADGTTALRSEPKLYREVIE